MHPFTKKRLAKCIWPRYSLNFDLINRNAQMLATIESYEQEPIRKCALREEMYSVVNDTIGGIAITYLEFGVFEGKSLEAWISINKDAASRFYGFDSFEGLPEVWTHSFGKTTGKERFDVGGVMPRIADPRVRLVKGLFQHTLRGFLSETKLTHPIVVHLDSDLHSSAMFVLCTLDPLLRAGDVVIFDEYAAPANEYLAWEEYKRAFMRSANCIAMNDQWFRVAFVLS